MRVALSFAIMVLMTSQTSVQPPPPAQPVVRAQEQLSDSDRKNGQLANVAKSLLHGWVKDSVFEDLAIRREMHRVGFVPACETLYRTHRDIMTKYAPAFSSAAIPMIRQIVPDEVLAQARYLSLWSYPLISYKNRISSALENAQNVSVAKNDMRATYAARLKKLRTDRNPNANIIMPRANVGRALGLSGAWNLDIPSHFGLACSEHVMPLEKLGVTITGGGPAQTSKGE